MSNIVFWQAGLLLLLCVSVVGLRIELIPFKAFGGVFGLSLLASLMLALIVLFKFITATHTNIQYAIVGLIIALATVGGVAYLLKQVSSVPRIHDITTNLTDIPQFTKALEQRKASDNSLVHDEKVAKQQRAAYPDLATLSSQLSFDESVKKATKIAQQLGWRVHFLDEKNGLIEATHISTLFGFVDDIIIRIKYADGQSQIDLRSASRVGESDLGANAKRIKAFSILFGQ